MPGADDWPRASEMDAHLKWPSADAGYGGALAVNLIGDNAHPTVTSAYIVNTPITLYGSGLTVTATNADAPLVPGRQTGLFLFFLAAVTGEWVLRRRNHLM